MSSFTTALRSLIIAFTCLVAANTVSAQTTEATTLKSRIAVVATETKTNIWVSDFPKNTTVVLFDAEDNIISIVSTNEYGAAYLSIMHSISNTIVAKTMNGEISASNKNKPKAEQNMVAIQETPSEATKA